MKQGTIKIGKIFSYITIVLAIALICGFLAYYTNGFTEDFKKFYVTIDGKDINSSATGFEIKTSEPMQAEVRYIFENDKNDISGFTVKVVPNPVVGKDFEFTVDGFIYSYQYEPDLTAGFDIEYSKNSFSIKPKGGIVEILSAVMPNSVIGDCSDKAYTDMYALKIYSYDGKASVTICFSVIQNVSGVILDAEVIKF